MLLMNNQFLSNGFLLASLMLLLTVTACKKNDDHDEDANDHDKPVLSITLPTDSMTYKHGDTVKIRGLVTDNSLHELFVSIVENTNDSVLFTDAPNVHDLSAFSIASNWKSQVTKLTNARVIVVAEDHNANVTSDTIRIQVLP